MEIPISNVLLNYLVRFRSSSWLQTYHQINQFYCNINDTSMPCQKNIVMIYFIFWRNI